MREPPTVKARIGLVTALVFSGCATARTGQSEIHGPAGSAHLPARSTVTGQEDTTAGSPSTHDDDGSTGTDGRDDWKHWVDADGDCQDARQEVLIAESEVPVTFKSSNRCKVATGQWTCPFTGEVFTDPGKLDIDHLVPLAEAHDSGAWSWDADRREAYANDLNAPEHLVAVKASANRSKGKKDPAAWLPPLESARCQYVADWRAVKDRWGLGMDTAEELAIAQVEASCDGVSTPEPAVTDSPRTKPGRACCRVCRSGKACGAGCIASDKPARSRRAVPATGKGACCPRPPSLRLQDGRDRHVVCNARHLLAVVAADPVGQLRSEGQSGSTIG